MLGTLDPHSSFFDPKEYAQMRERQEGRDDGLGDPRSAAIDGDIVAQSVFEGSPANKDGRAPAAMSSRGSRAKTRRGGRPSRRWSRLRGPKGTNVRIEVKRRGYEQC